MPHSRTPSHPVRVLIILFSSDDCGLTFQCWDGDQIWNPREFAPFFSVPGMPGTLWMGGGFSQGIIPSVGVWFSQGTSGITWQRPPCAAPPCNYPYNQPPDPQSWLFPIVPALPGQLASDWYST